MGATLSLAYRGSLDPDHILYGLLSGSADTRQVRLRSGRLFVPAARNLLDNLARLGIRASEWTNHKWNAEYCENASRLCVFVPETGARPVEMGLPRAAWVKLNCLRTGVGRFHSSMHKWGLAPSPNCECGASEQTTDHVLTACPIHRAPYGARGLTVLDDQTRCWLPRKQCEIGTILYWYPFTIHACISPILCDNRLHTVWILAQYCIYGVPNIEPIQC